MMHAVRLPGRLTVSNGSSTPRYQKVPLDPESDSEDDETILYAASSLNQTPDNSVKDGGENFGLGMYNHSRDLDLPRVRRLPPKKKDRFHRDPLSQSKYSRMQAAFIMCLVLVSVTVVLVIAGGLIIIGNSGTSNISSSSTTVALSSCIPTPSPCPRPPPPIGVVTSTDEPSLDLSPTTDVITEDLQTASSVRTEPGTNVPPDKKTENAAPSTTATPPELVGTTTETITSEKPAVTSADEKPAVANTDEKADLLSTDEPSTVEKIDTNVAPSTDDSTTSEKPTTEDVSPSTSAATDSPNTPITNAGTRPEDTSPTSDLDTPEITMGTNSEEASPTTIDMHETTTDTDGISPTTVNAAPETDRMPQPEDSPPTINNTDIQQQPSHISWEKEYFPSASDCSIQLYDLNGDGLSDIVTVVTVNQCKYKVLVLSGVDGSTIWETNANYDVFSVRCELDVNQDGVDDCLISGRQGGFSALNGLDGTALWEIDPSITFPRYNFYFPIVIGDLDGDGVRDIINTHGGDILYRPEDVSRSPGMIVVVSGKTGGRLMEPMQTPDGRETYSSPVYYAPDSKREFVLFGSGGETIPGSLWALDLVSVKQKVMVFTAHKHISQEVYEPSLNDTRHPCFMDSTLVETMRPKFDKEAYDFGRPVSDSKRLSSCLPWGSNKPIWNKYGACIYQLYKSSQKGVMLPPVIIDLNEDSVLDLVVSTFDGHTAALDGKSGGSLLWDRYYQDTETYSLPTPLYYTQDSTPDLLIRTNKGEWMEYNSSSLRLLDGTDGSELWTFESTRSTMMSSLSLVSNTHGRDAMLIVTTGIGMEAEPQSDDRDPRHNQGYDEYGPDPPSYVRVGKRHEGHEHKGEEHEGEELVGEAVEVDQFEDKKEDFDFDNGDDDSPVMDSVDYSNDHMMLVEEPPDLWTSTLDDPVPDRSDLDAFLTYCGYEKNDITLSLYLVTREMIISGMEIKPIAVHTPVVISLPTVNTSSSDHTPDHTVTMEKRHGPSHNPTPNMQDYKTMRCNHIALPTMNMASPAIGDFNNDTRLDIAYTIVYTPKEFPPLMRVQAFTIEDKFIDAYGTEILDFDMFVSLSSQPWTKYMGKDGTNTFT